MPQNPPAFLWLRTGDDAFAAMLRAIDAARTSVDLESYMFADSPLTQRFRTALLAARGRGVRVRALVDAFGSFTLDDAFWAPLLEAKGEFRWFNPMRLHRFGFRNHRKLLTCDRRVAFIGGFNLCPEWEGDGVQRGWRDLGAQIEGELAAQLADSFETLWERADFRHPVLAGRRVGPAQRRVATGSAELLTSGPGRGPSPILRALREDLTQARDVRIVAAYFLPSLRLRRLLARSARAGHRVEIVLPGLSDVPLAKLAAESVYPRLLAAGVRIFEYQPQILHTKLFLLDQSVYLGSSNFDLRSLHINYELLVRVTESSLAREAHQVFDDHLRHSRAVELSAWLANRSLWRRLLQRAAFWLLARLDPFVAYRQLRSLR